MKGRIGTKSCCVVVALSCEPEGLIMLADISMAVMAGVLIPVDAPAQPPSETPQVYVELIVKACPADQPDVQADRPDAVRGYYAEPINQGKSYENERSPMGHTGYLIAMQYLQENPAYKKSFPDVGEWSCIEHSFPVQGVAGM